MTINDFLFSATKQLASVDVPRLTAELFLANVLSLNRADLYVQPDRMLTSEEDSRFESFVQRRLADEPVAYILGKAWFMGLEFEVNRHVLIPRPETEGLVAVAGHVGAGPSTCPGVVMDVGTGSGCIAISLAMRLPGVEVYATEVSAEALEVATRNAQRHGVHVHFRQGNLLEPVREELNGCPVFIVSNPPYIPSKDVAALERDVRDYEPTLALDGGKDGLGFYRRILEQAKNFQVMGFAFEVGIGQAKDVRALISNAFPNLRVHVSNDLAGIPRVVFASY